ncbi:MAG: ABC transporter permease [Planctomycetes bacterium]|nr:ABC transporter permease [Planctomycetota bacterium]
MALPFSYHWRNLLVRKTTTGLNILVVAAVVGVFCWLIGFAGALHSSLATASDSRKLIVLKSGATSESNSAIRTDEYNKLNQIAEVERLPGSGAPLISPEMIVQVQLPRVRDQGTTRANVGVRGVTETALQVHRNIKVLGRSFAPGAQEVIAGVSAAKQFGGLEIGETIHLGYASDRPYRIVGYFSAAGGPLESEIWGYLPSLMNAYNRAMYSSASMLLQPGAAAEPVITQINGPAIQLKAQTEAQYWSEQAKNIRIYLNITYVLVAIMSLAAIFSIANTMFSSVAGRTREIAMLRTIGFSGVQILTGFLLEAVMLSLLGAVMGCLGCAAWLATVGRTKDMFGATTFTSLAFEIQLTPMIILAALGCVALVGAVGALFPAWRAARVQVVTALREA